MGLLKSEMSEKFSKIASIGSKKHDERVELTSATRPKVRKCLIIMNLMNPFKNLIIKISNENKIRNIFHSANCSYLFRCKNIQDLKKKKTQVAKHIANI